MRRLIIPRTFTLSKQMVLYWAVFAVLTFFVGFRWDVGIDWLTYMNVFGGNMFETAFYLERMEPGNLLIKLALLLSGYEDGGYFLWVMGLITMFFFFRSIRDYSVAPFFSVALFVLLGTYFDLMNGVRQFAAVSLIVFSWRFLFRGSLVRYILAVLVASLFHFSALVMLPVYFVCNLKFNKQFLIALAVTAIPLSFFIGSVVGKMMGMFERYDVYSESQYAEAGGVLSMLRAVFPLLLFSMIMMKYDVLTVDRKDRILTNLALFSIFVTLLFPSVALMIRISFYFQVAFMFVIPLLCTKLTASNAKVFGVFSLLYASAFIWVTQLSRPIANILPFEFDFRLAGPGLLKVLVATMAVCFVFIGLMRLGWKNIKA